MKWTHRKAQASDFDYLWVLHQETMKTYIEKTWGWDEDAQKRFFTDKFAPEDYQLIVVDGQVVGCTEYRWHSHELNIVNLEIEPAHQNRGLGTEIIKSLCERALAKRRDVSVRVLKCNPAMRLFQRLHFEPTIETDTHVTLVWKHRKYFTLEDGVKK